MIWNERLKELREENGLTLLEVANKLNISESTAQRYESTKGIKNIPYDALVKYANLLNVSPSYIMGWESKEPKQHSLSDNAYRVGLAYQNADERTKTAVEVALGIEFKKGINTKDLCS